MPFALHHVITKRYSSNLKARRTESGHKRSNA